MSALFAHTLGKGQPIIFLHGYCETHKVWLPFAEPFGKNFSVALIDLPGCGKSPLPSGTISIESVSGAVAAWLEQNDLSESVIVGHSLGGYVTLALAEKFPSLVKGFCLFHSTCYSDTAEKKENRNKVIEFVKKNGVKPFTDTLIPGLFADKFHPAVKELLVSAADSKAESVIAYAQAMRDRPDRTEQLKTDIPKLIIAGRKDTTIPMDASLKMSKTALNSTFLELPDAAHMGMVEAGVESQKAIELFAKRAFFKNSI